VTDPATGELVLTARLAGFGGAPAADVARGEAAYWRECVEYAAGMLAEARLMRMPWVQACLGAESYLRMTLELDGADGSDGAEVMA
jgi:hypothetical protein